MYFQIFAMHFESFSNEFIDFFQNQLNQWIQIQIELSTSRNADSTNGSWRLQSLINRPHKAPFHIDKNNLKSGCQRIKRRNLSTVVGKNTTLTIIMNEVKKNQAARKFTGENVKSCCCESTRIFGKIMKMPKFIQISIKRLKNFIFSSVALWFWLLLQELLEIKVKSGRKQNVQFPVEEFSQAHPERERKFCVRVKLSEFSPFGVYIPIPLPSQELFISDVSKRSSLCFAVMIFLFLLLSISELKFTTQHNV